jgi:AcrR family transcriptional regulator
MPNRAAELDWDEAEAAVEPRGLTRAAIVATAIALADAQGIRAVSIRRVAAELEARPMSLYTHIAAKGDLVDLMVNAVLGEVLVPEPLPVGWRAALTAIAHASYDTFVRHDWVLDAFPSTTRSAPNGLRHGEQSAAAIAELGLDPATTWTLLGVLDDYTIGHALRAATVARLGDDHPKRRNQPKPIDPVEHPHLTRVAPGGRIAPRPDSFAIGLDVILDGIAARFLS